MASILDRGPDADKTMDPRNSIASDFAEDEVVHDFGYSPSYARFFRSLGAMSLTMAMASCTRTSVDIPSSVFVAGMANITIALTSIASLAWASSSSICTIIDLFTGWVPTNPIIFAVAIATCAACFFTASIRMDKASLVFIPSGYTNYGDWGETVSVTFNFFCAVWVITGWNAPSAVAEETHNARIVAPRSIINTYCLQAGMGMLFCILLAFCITDMDAAASDPT
ncbi:UGA4-GABA permease-also involved in delta-aminolevulinate transport [Fusarium agapanthi]|uniref:UGA4-GABA permease-also involved in delta-aminolevulinate transport n=1 Tax=Fusarium agapanthi TaxID=1803897 RepID=A0A9P5BKR2_9HYPO|nr:UGA4-GABA permease-also involved in delta-aminolevulinate transport [Fusarium agapanthi]